MTIQETLIDAIRKIYGDADTLFNRIKDDLDRGLVEEARRRLNFVDKLLERDADYPTSCPTDGSNGRETARAAYP